MSAKLDCAAIGARIRMSREAAGLTQAELVERADLSTAHIGHIERGTRIASLEALFSISQALHSSIDSLLRDSSGDDISFFISLAASVKSKKTKKVKNLCRIIRVLSENIDEL